MRVFLLGVSHHTAPVELREQLDFSSRDAGAAARTLLEATDVSEAVLLSTCNRSEVYVATEDAAAARVAVLGFLAAFHELPEERFAPHLFERADDDAVRHLFRVAAGLDSRILGEPQILGQVKDAFQSALDAQSAGPLLARLFQSAFGTGKRVRSETSLGKGAVSLGYAAVELARRTFGRIEGRRVLVVGAGEICTLAARHLRAQGAGVVTVTNRSEAAAEALAHEVQGTAVRWEHLVEAVADADIVVTGTGAPRPILTSEGVGAAMHSRAGRPLFMIDLAVPRDVDPHVGAIGDVFLFNVDDLQALMHENTSKRTAEVMQAESIVADELTRFSAWRRATKAVPTIVALRRHFERVRSDEMARLGVKLSGLSPDERVRVDEVTRLIVEKLLLAPTECLKAAPDEDTQAAYAAAVGRLFDLDDQQDVDGAPSAPHVMSQRS